jgi:hypothetical protein
MSHLPKTNNGCATRRSLRLRLVAPVALLCVSLAASQPTLASPGSTGMVRGEVLAFATGSPVAGATVTLLDFGVRTTSRPDGSFDFGRAFPTQDPYRRIQAVVTAPGFGNWTVRGVPLYPGDTLLLHAELREGDWTHDVLTPAERALLPQAPTVTSTYTHTCTGWDADLVPPQTINVWITADNVAKNYDFVFYLDHVLPDEWIPSWLPDSLGAGAIAVKTFAAYRAESGHAYSGGAGCADLTDWTSDQVFDPTWASVFTSQAVNATEGSIARKDNKLFLAQYFAGAKDDPCAPVEGQFKGRMSQWGTLTCATDGVLWPDIVTTYYQTAKLFYLYNLLLNASLQSDEMYPWLFLPGTTIARTLGGAFNGTAYITLTPPAGKNGTLYQDRPFLGDAGDLYHEEVALRCGPENATACSVTLRLIAKPASGANWVNRYKVTVPKDGLWYLYDYDPPAPTIDHVTIELSVITASTIGVDAATLTGPFGGP